MPHFDELPDDILLGISEFCLPDKQNLCSLRLVSRRLSILVSLILFHRLVVKIPTIDEQRATQDVPKVYSIISEMASGSTAIFEHTKELIFHTRTSMTPMDRCKLDETIEMKRQLVGKMFDAISMLRNLRSIDYVSNPQEDPEELHYEVVRALGMLPLFRAFTKLHFTRDPPSSFTLGPISNLTEFSGSFGKTPHFIREIASLLTRCPHLIRLKLRGYPLGKYALNDIFSEVGKMEKALRLKELRLYGLTVSASNFESYIRHFKNLTSIAVTANKSPSASVDLGAICNILQQNDIYLEHVSTDHLEDPLLLSYLSSYSGLTRLEVVRRCRGIKDLEAVNRLYTQVLPKHAEVLTELLLDFDIFEILSGVPTKNQLTVLAKCRQLKTLITPSSFMPENIENARTIWGFWLDVGLQLPDLEYMSIHSLATRSRYLYEDEWDAWHTAREEVVAQYQKEKKIKFMVV